VSLALAVSLGACGGSGGKSAAGTSAEHMHHGDAGAACDPKGTTVDVSAVNLEFDTKCLAVPAGVAFKIRFDNKENVAHDFTIITDDGEKLFGTEIFNGPKVVELQASSMQGGTYAFHCDVHPAMHGTFLAK
jgi:plastocyanin